MSSPKPVAEHVRVDLTISLDIVVVVFFFFFKPIVSHAAAAASPDENHLSIAADHDHLSTRRLVTRQNSGVDALAQVVLCKRLAKMPKLFLAVSVPDLPKSFVRTLFSAAEKCDKSPWRTPSRPTPTKTLVSSLPRPRRCSSLNTKQKRSMITREK